MTKVPKKVTHTWHLGVPLTSGDHPNPDPHTMHVKQVAALGKAANAPDKDSD